MRSGLKVSELWRFPVKSLQGERLDRVRIDTDGLLGDRRFALFDVETGFGLTGRREPRLLMASARVVDKGDGVEIELPDGSIARDNDDLSRWLGRKIELVDARQASGARYESPDDIDTELEWHVFEGPGGAFHDTDLFRVSLVSTATIGAWPARRFRANVVLDGAGEDELVGSDVALGEAVLHVQWQIPRCVMVTREQPGDIERDLAVLKTIQRDRDGYLAIGATVVTPGEVAVGEELH